MSEPTESAKALTRLIMRLGHVHTYVVQLSDDLDRVRIEHDRRVTDLLEANNAEVERRRAAEEQVRVLKIMNAGLSVANGTLIEGLDAAKIEVIKLKNANHALGAEILKLKDERDSLRSEIKDNADREPGP